MASLNYHLWGGLVKLQLISIFKSICVLLVFSSLAIGCKTIQTYDGNRLPPDQVARLTCASSYYFVATRSCYIQKVDDRTLPDSGREVDLLPGKHEVVVFLKTTAHTNQRQTYRGPQTFSFIAAAGHIYTVDGSWFSDGHSMWIIDEQTKEVVAGRKP